MKALLKYISEIFAAISSLWRGMRVTGRYFVSPREIVTQQYPENRASLQMFDRFKGEIIMPHNEKNEHKCTGCGICQINCPNGSIEVFTKMEEVDGKPRKTIDRHIYHLDMCTFCGLCVKTCPSDALDFGQGFEHAMFDRAGMTKQLNRPGSVLMAKPTTKSVPSSNSNKE